MGESVLTPEEIFLGKAWKGRRGNSLTFFLAVGEREFGPKFRNRFVGN